MTHSELKRIHKSGGTAVLFLHGILGTPRHFDFLLSLVPESWSLWAPLLPGHGGSCSDFSRSSMEEWTVFVEKAISELRESHERIYLVGHSMGTLLALGAASRSPEKIVGIFALAAPLRIHFTPRAALACLHSVYRKAESDTAFLRATREACSVALSKNPFAYIGWLPRYLELFSLSREIRQVMPRLAVPCLAIQSTRDELVSRKSLRLTGNAKSIELPGSFHYFYNEKDLETIKAEFENFIKA